MGIQPEGEQLRKAIRWISEKLQNREGATLSQLLAEACLKFDLSPADSEFLMRFFLEKKKKG